MKNGDGLVVKDWKDLSHIPLDKLIKLRDVAIDDQIRLHQEYSEARTIETLIRIEISSRQEASAK